MERLLNSSTSQSLRIGLVPFAVVLLIGALLVPGALAANPGHGAASVAPGIFEWGNFTFPAWLFVNQTLNVTGDICLGGSCQSSWPGGSYPSITDNTTAVAFWGEPMGNDALTIGARTNDSTANLYLRANRTTGSGLGSIYWYEDSTYYTSIYSSTESGSTEGGRLEFRIRDSNDGSQRTPLVVSASRDILLNFDGGWTGLLEATPDALFEISADGGTSDPRFMISSNDDADGDLFIVDNGSGNVGIGTPVPNATLHVVGDSLWAGSLIPQANDTYSLGNSTHVWKDVWVGNNSLYIGGKPLRASGTGSLVWDGAIEVNGTLQTAGGNARGTSAVDLQSSRTDDTRVASGDYSVISGGNSNLASSSYAAVSGGYANRVSGTYSTISGGGTNQITSATYATIGGGSSHNIGANGNYATIAGGENHDISYGYGTIVGGKNNIARLYATVGGGIENDALGSYSSIIGGTYLTAQGYAQTVVGQYNILQGTGNSRIAGDQVFIVGNGTGTSARSNAFYITNEGDVWTGSLNVSRRLYAPEICLSADCQSSWPSSSSLWTNSSGDATYTAGSVGVGTTSPAAPLHVVGNATDDYALFVEHDGNNESRGGIRIQAGLDDASGTTYYLTAQDGDGDLVGYLAQNASDFQLYTVSDERLKQNIRAASVSGKDKISGLIVRDFQFRGRSAEHTGFVAQEVQKVLPQAVMQSPDGTLAVSYTAMVPYLVKAFQEQQAQIDALSASPGKPQQSPTNDTNQAEIDALRAQVAALEARLAALESQLSTEDGATTIGNGTQIRLDRDGVTTIIG